HRVEAHTLVVLPDDAAVTLAAPAGARVALIGGAPLGPRLLWWNFVSTRKERIVQAAADWQADRLGHVAGETERIPLPEKSFSA
ncbi:MAG TPA: pirin-like C-terminal cupin domain-containing protein, partial [Methylibium sp.]|nr:pirin-like C-terminal cupin domain-containing protein [Methylibium sp.]